MVMQHEHGARTCSIEASTCTWKSSMNMQNSHVAYCKMQSGYEAWTCSINMYMQHGHAALTCICSMDMQHVVQHKMQPCSMDIQHGHTAWTYSTDWIHDHCITDMDIQHGHKHATWTWTCRMVTDIQYGHVHATLTYYQHRHGHAAFIN
jgi:hypothetical protein